MIDEKKLAELKAGHTTWVTTEAYETLEALWKVVRAAKRHFRYFHPGYVNDDVLNALTALHDSAKEKDGPKKTNNLTYEDTV